MAAQDTYIFNMCNSIGLFYSIHAERANHNACDMSSEKCFQYTTPDVIPGQRAFKICTPGVYTQVCTPRLTKFLVCSFEITTVHAS